MVKVEDGKGIISHVIEYTYLGVRITKDGNYEPEINDRINLLMHTGHVMHQQFKISTTVRSTHTVFMCFVFI